MEEIKLTDLDPKFFYSGLKERHGMGLTFDCPIHKEHKLAVAFENPLDGGEPIKEKYLWKRDGDTFDNMTLSPSIDASRCLLYPGCWHGFIKNGIIC